MRFDGDQALGFERAQRLAQRAAADVQLFAQFNFTQSLAALDAPVHDGRAQKFLDAGAQGGWLLKNRAGGTGHGKSLDRKDAIYPAGGQWRAAAGPALRGPLLFSRSNQLTRLSDNLTIDVLVKIA
ncbi:hypothetical protein D3C71_1501990 [compost metagenome]